MNNILNYFYDNNEYNENFNCEDINRPFEDYLNYDQLLAYYRYERDQRVINTAIHDAKNEGINLSLIHISATLDISCIGDSTFGTATVST